jgi:hypothetical protein
MCGEGQAIRAWLQHFSGAQFDADAAFLTAFLIYFWKGFLFNQEQTPKRRYYWPAGIQCMV